MCHAVLGLLELLNDLLHVLLKLLLAGPFHQLVPISTGVNGTEAVDTVDSFIHNFQSRVSLAHQALAEEIDAVADMTRPNVDVNVIISELCPIEGRIVVDPVAFTDVVLGEGQSTKSMHACWMDYLPGSAVGERSKK